MRDDGRSREALIAEIVALRGRVRALEDERATTVAVLYGDGAGETAPLLGEVPAIVWTVDLDLRLTWWTGGGINALALDPDSVIGMDIYTFLGTADPTIPAIAAHHSALTGKRSTYEIELDGLFISGHTAPILGADGKVRGVVGVGLDITKRRRAEEDRELLIGELREALRRVKALSGLIPICMHCKNVRNDTGFWEQVETYVHDHSEAEFTHAICPECMDRALADGAES